MRQNEKTLVYVVTGFLFVILAVAVLFGKDGAARTKTPTPAQGTGQTAVSLEDLFRGQGQMLPDQEQGEPAPVIPEQPLAANVQLGPPTPGEEVAMLLGRSQRDRECRVVTARAGDTLRELVIKWCGSLEYLPLAERMNEDAALLRVGQDVVLPWVPDEEVLAALQERKAGRSPRPGAAAPVEASAGGGAPVPAPAGAPSASRVYVVKAGDVLWKIAEREVGLRKAPAFIQQVRELNPGVDVNALRVGQQIKLPVRNP